MDRIDNGATITLTYYLRSQDDTENAGAGDGVADDDSLIRVSTDNVSTVFGFHHSDKGARER